MRITADQFKSSLSAAHPPSGQSPYLQALWYDGKGDWNKAHELIQDLPDRNASHIHAYLHRKEGDQFNAQYWYNKAAQSMPGYSLEREWEELVTKFLD
jgi:hypothetical protein